MSVQLGVTGISHRAAAAADANNVEKIYDDLCALRHIERPLDNEREYSMSFFPSTCAPITAA